MLAATARLRYAAPALHGLRRASALEASPQTRFELAKQLACGMPNAFHSFRCNHVETWLLFSMANSHPLCLSLRCIWYANPGQPFIVRHSLTNMYNVVRRSEKATTHQRCTPAAASQHED